VLFSLSEAASTETTEAEAEPWEAEAPMEAEVVEAEAPMKAEAMTEAKATMETSEAGEGLCACY